LIQQQKKQFEALSAASKVFLEGFPQLSKLLKDQKGSLFFDNESMGLYQDALDIILSNEWFKNYQLMELQEWLELQDLTLNPADPCTALDKDGKKVPVPSYLRKVLDNLLIQMSKELGMALEVSKKNRMKALEQALYQPTREEPRPALEPQEEMFDERHE
jgi:hypothetical protein